MNTQRCRLGGTKGKNARLIGSQATRAAAAMEREEKREEDRMGADWNRSLPLTPSDTCNGYQSLVTLIGSRFVTDNETPLPSSSLLFPPHALHWKGMAGESAMQPPLSHPWVSHFPWTTPCLPVPFFATAAAAASPSPILPLLPMRLPIPQQSTPHLTCITSSSRHHLPPPNPLAPPARRSRPGGALCRALPARTALHRSGSSHPCQIGRPASQASSSSLVSHALQRPPHPLQRRFLALCSVLSERHRLCPIPSLPCYHAAMLPCFLPDPSHPERVGHDSTSSAPWCALLSCALLPALMAAELVRLAGEDLHAWRSNKGSSRPLSAFDQRACATLLLHALPVSSHPPQHSPPPPTHRHPYIPPSHTSFSYFMAGHGRGGSHHPGHQPAAARQACHGLQGWWGGEMGMRGK
ncbi:unnamed protein product [Closterium sp. Naga37s-1]|nr:unnamed protein product [Closterium sp. Naga37s-1]